MTTIRGTNHQLSGSSVWTNGDLVNLIEALYYQSLRSGANGEYARGLADMAFAIAAACNAALTIRQRQPEISIAVADVEVRR